MTDLDDLTRAVMREINSHTPGTRLAEVPTLFAFGPIRNALQAIRDEGAAERDTLKSTLIGVKSSWRKGPCWCDYSHNVKDYGHQSKCRAALACVEQK